MTFRTTYKTPAPFGDLTLLSDGEALTGFLFAGSRDEQKHSARGLAREESDLPVFDDTRRWLDIYFSGHQPDFTPRYRLPDATPFRQRVSEAMLSIPYGATVTYGELAGRLGSSARAVGGAVGWNPICVIIPCHRVIGSDGAITGYNGGIKNKLALLAHERN